MAEIVAGAARQVTQLAATAERLQKAVLLHLLAPLREALGADLADLGRDVAVVADGAHDEGQDRLPTTAAGVTLARLAGGERTADGLRDVDTPQPARQPLDGTAVANTHAHSLFCPEEVQDNHLYVQGRIIPTLGR